MVSYYNTMSYPTKHSAANLAYAAGQPWQWAANYHAAPSHQYVGEMDTSHPTHHQMFYNHHMFHPATNATAASDWHSPSTAENFSQNAEMLTQHQLVNGSSGVNGVNGSAPPGSSGSSSSTTTTAPITGSSQLNHAGSNIENQHQRQQQHSAHITEGLPSPPITVSGSEISSPDVPPSSLSPHQMAQRVTNNNNSPSSINNNNSAAINNNHRGSPLTTYPTFEWMKKTTTYQAQPAPGKTRTKDKYRVVYTDCQRLELEKEYCSSRYITIRRKTELARVLSLSERQVKIWFQNRRAKERKQNKKVNEPTLGAVQHPDYGNIMDTKPKLEPSLHLPHTLHSLNPMAMTMPGMRLHPHLHNLPLSAHSHQLHQSSHAQISAATVSSVGSIPM